jgi:hypothetical protein
MVARVKATFTAITKRGDSSSTRGWSVFGNGNVMPHHLMWFCDDLDSVHTPKAARSDEPVKTNFECILLRSYGSCSSSRCGGLEITCLRVSRIVGRILVLMHIDRICGRFHLIHNGQEGRDCLANYRVGVDPGQTCVGSIRVNDKEWRFCLNDNSGMTAEGKR